MRKIIGMLLVACILLMAAGCNEKNTKNTPPTSTNGSGKAESTQSPAQTSGSAAPPETAQADASKVSFQYTKVSPSWKQIDRFDGNYDFILMEDGQSVLHLIYNDYSLQTYHCFQQADGNWSEPRQIVKESLNFQGYWVGTAPDGSLCFAWKEGVYVQREGWSDVLHISLFSDGQWWEDPKIYDFKGAEGVSSITISWFSVAFDTQGEPHFFYEADGDYDPPESGGEMPMIVGGLFLDGQQLTQHGITRERQESLVQGVGDIGIDFSAKPVDKNVFFYIDSRNVYHLIGLDANSPMTSASGIVSVIFAEWCIHSYSRDGGKTWEGPFTVFDGEEPISRILLVEDAKGNLMLMAYRPGSDEASLLFSTLKPDSYKAGTPEGYFGEKQMDEDLWEMPYEERMRYSSIEFQGMLLDSMDMPHFVGSASLEPSLHTFYDITQISENAWSVRDIEKPEGDYVNIVTMFLRRNGNFILLASESGKLEPIMLFYAEIPAE